MSKVLIFLVEGFEEIEAFAPIDLLRRGSVDVTTVSITRKREVISSKKIEVKTDKIIEEINFEDYEMIILPGGAGTKNYLKSEKLLNELKNYEKNKKIAAICAGPTIFSGLNLLENKEATCFPACEEELRKGNAIYKNENVVKFKNIITSKAAGTSIDFALEILKELKGEEESNRVKEEIYYK